MMGLARYTLPGWPNAVPGHSAAMPQLTSAAGGGSVQYKDGLQGEPGTQNFPLSGPGVDETSPAAQATMGLSQSRNSQGFRPNLYYARPQGQFWPGAGQPVSVRSDNLMPVPAVDPRGIPAVMASAPLQRGGAQIRWPGANITWPNWTGQQS